MDNLTTTIITFVLTFAMNELLTDSVGGQLETVRRIVYLRLLVDTRILVENIVSHFVNIIDEVRQLRKGSRLFSDGSEAKNGS